MEPQLTTKTKTCPSDRLLADRNNPPTFSLRRGSALGAAGGDGAEPGCCRDDASVSGGSASETLGSFAEQDEEPIEDRLKGLAFRKQISYR